MHSKNNYFLLDARSIGAFRIVLGTVVLVNILFSRWMVASEYYYPVDSLFPLDWHRDQFGSSGFSIFNILPGNAGVHLFMFASAAIALMFTLGYKTKIAAPLLYFCWWNLNQRNPLLMAGWDTYIDCLLMCALFLPLDSRFSLSGRKGVALPDRFQHPAGLLILLQVAFIYFLNGLAKCGPTWLDGTAVSRMTEDAVLATGIHLPSGFSAPLSYLTLTFEGIFPFLIFLPWRNGILRLVAAAGILLFHAGIAIYVNIGYFPYAAVAIAVVLLPATFWNRWVKPIPGEMPAGPKFLKWIVWPIIAILCLISLHTMSTSGFLKKPLQAIALDKITDAILPPKFENASWLNQEWKLYGPDPPSVKGYLYVTGTTVNQTTVAVRPKHPRKAFTENRVMFFFAAGMRFRMGDVAFKPAFTPWLLYEVRSWNAAHPVAKLNIAEIWYHDIGAGSDQKVARIELDY